MVAGNSDKGATRDGMMKIANAGLSDSLIPAPRVTPDKPQRKALTP